MRTENSFRNGVGKTKVAFTYLLLRVTDIKRTTHSRDMQGERRDYPVLLQIIIQLDSFISIIIQFFHYYTAFMRKTFDVITAMYSRPFPGAFPEALREAIPVAFHKGFQEAFHDTFSEAFPEAFLSRGIPRGVPCISIPYSMFLRQPCC